MLPLQQGGVQSRIPQGVWHSQEKERKEIKYQIHCMVLDYLNKTALKENVVLFGEI